MDEIRETNENRGELLKPKVRQRNRNELPRKYGDLDKVLELGITKLKEKSCSQVKYPENDLQGFCAECVKYFEYVQEQNRDAEPEEMLMCDVEGLCIWLGIGRTTLFNYAHRSPEWSDAISKIKDVIAYTKKNLAFKGSINPVLFIFDACNNHGYTNASEFHLSNDTASRLDEVQEHQSAAELVEKYRGLLPETTDTTQNDVLGEINIVKEYSE